MEAADRLARKLLCPTGRAPGARILGNPADSNDIVAVCHAVREVFLQQPMLLEVPAPVRVCGDIHGQYYDLLRIFTLTGVPSPDNPYVFLGDYVDRGPHSVEVITLLFALKVKYPTALWLLRGNHESNDLNRIYGFWAECRDRFSVKLWKTFGDCFNVMPIAGVIAQKIFCAHGGISPGLMAPGSLAAVINAVPRPALIPRSGVMCDVLWSDPSRKVLGWAANDRGVSYTFSVKEVKGFLAAHDLELIVRAHEVVQDGYELFGNRRLVTVFSAPNYSRQPNAGAILIVPTNLVLEFVVLSSAHKPATAICVPLDRKS